MPFAHGYAVCRVERCPHAGPPLHPRVALPSDRLVDRGVRVGVQVTGDVPGRHATGPQQADDEMADVLAYALALAPRLHRTGLHTGRARLVCHLVEHSRT